MNKSQIDFVKSQIQRIAADKRRKIDKDTTISEGHYLTHQERIDWVIANADKFPLPIAKAYTGEVSYGSLASCLDFSPLNTPPAYAPDRAERFDALDDYVNDLLLSFVLQGEDDVKSMLDSFKSREF